MPKKSTASESKKNNPTTNELKKLEKKVKQVKKANPKDAKLKFKIVDLEKEKADVKNSLDELEKELKNHSAQRKDILREVNASMDSYTNQLLEYEKRLNSFDLKEIEYKNQERELEDYIEMYNDKCEEFNEEVSKLNKEILMLRKKMLSNEALVTTFKSMIILLVNKYGITEISEVTGVEKEVIEKNLQE